MSLLEDARGKLGSLFLIGFHGLELTDDTAAFISQAGIGGVILFSQNYENPGQVAELVNQIQECRNPNPLWVSVDHEGGRVQRFRKPFTKIPDALTLAKLNSPKLVFDVADLMAKELKAVGVNVNFCPVADIATNPKNPIIGPRAFGSSEEEVSKFVTAMVRGHLVNDVQPCVKHFPGHGDTHTDSHLALPKVDTPLDVLHDREFRPFSRAFKSRCSMVMTAHILNPTLDPKLPATLSPRILKEILRQDLRYSKLIISDDMEMKAITDHFGPDEAPVLALNAGCDILIYRTEAGARHAYEAVIKALEKGNIAPETIINAAERCNSLKLEVLRDYTPVNIAEIGSKIGSPEAQALMEKFN